MGDCPTEPMQPQFGRRLRLEFHGAKVTSDAGLPAYRELDDALDLTDSAAAELHDTRTGRDSRHSLTALSRQSIFSRPEGYEDLNDAERLRLDPAMRTIVGGRARGHMAASTSEIARFETETLTTRTNLNRLTDLSGRWIDRPTITASSPSSSSTWTARSGRPTVGSRARPMTATPAALASIPCSSSISSATWNE